MKPRHMDNFKKPHTNKLNVKKKDLQLNGRTASTQRYGIPLQA